MGSSDPLIFIMICEKCSQEFEYDEGISYDCDTFSCFDCIAELETNTINYKQKGSN